MNQRFTSPDGFMISEPSLQIKKLIPDAILPIRASSGSVGYDLFASEDLLLTDRACVSTGLAMVIPDGHYGRIAPRSGLTVKFGIQVGAGVIDPDYRGEVKVVLFNHGKEPFQIKRGDKIAQLILEKVSIVNVVEVKELDETQRGEGGFGSSGMKYAKPNEEIECYFGPYEDAPANGGPGLRNEFRPPVPWSIRPSTTVFGPVDDDQRDYLFNKVDAKTKETWERNRNSIFNNVPVKAADGWQHPFEIDKNEVAEKAWEHRKNNSFGTCAMCSVCGGSSTSFCSCAKKKFMDSFK